MASQPVNHRSDGTYWAVWLKDIPAFGYKKYTIKPEDATITPDIANTENILENRWYKIVTDPAKGTIKSWFDKELQIELVDQASEYRMGEFILEQLGNRSQMESKRLDDFKRSAS